MQSSFKACLVMNSRRVTNIHCSDEDFDHKEEIEIIFHLSSSKLIPDSKRVSIIHRYGYGSRHQQQHLDSVFTNRLPSLIPERPHQLTTLPEDDIVHVDDTDDRDERFVMLTSTGHRQEVIMGHNDPAIISNERSQGDRRDAPPSSTSVKRTNYSNSKTSTIKDYDITARQPNRVLSSKRNRKNSSLPTDKNTSNNDIGTSNRSKTNRSLFERKRGSSSRRITIYSSSSSNDSTNTKQETRQPFSSSRRRRGGGRGHRYGTSFAAAGPIGS